MDDQLQILLTYTITLLGFFLGIWKWIEGKETKRDDKVDQQEDKLRTHYEIKIENLQTKVDNLYIKVYDVQSAMKNELIATVKQNTEAMKSLSSTHENLRGEIAPLSVKTEEIMRKLDELLLEFRGHKFGSGEGTSGTD